MISKDESVSDSYCDEVLSGQTPVERVAETDRTLAFRHTRPYWPVHLVVIPKHHVASLLECDDTLLLELMHSVKELARQVVETEGACRVATNLGGYQESKHLHWHVGAGERLR